MVAAKYWDDGDKFTKCFRIKSSLVLDSFGSMGDDYDDNNDGNVLDDDDDDYVNNDAPDDDDDNSQDVSNDDGN